MKDKRLYLRVTEDEKYQLKIKADIAHMSISEYIITLSENKKIYTGRFIRFADVSNAL